MLKKIMTFFRSKYKPGPGEFLELDANVIIKNLKIEKFGAQRGAANLPAANDSVRDDIEQEIISKIHSVAYDAKKRTLEQNSNYIERVTSLNDSGIAAEMLAIARCSESNMESEILRIKGELKQARLEVMERQDALNKFRKDNGLTRPANPEKNKFLLFAFMLVLFTIETLPSAILLANDDSFGVLGGYTKAIGFSFLNLTMGFIVGRYCLPSSIHKKPAVKIIGVVTTCILIIGILLLNFSFAHLRHAAEMGATSMAFTNMIEHPFNIGDLTSISMIGLGIMFSFFAMIDGWIWDDHYLGYGAVTKNLHNAQNYYNYLLEEKLNNIKIVETNYIKEIADSRSYLRERRSALPRISQESTLLIKKYYAYLNHLQDVGNRILKKYYACNRASRTEAPPPHFDTEWTIDGYSLDLPTSVSDYLSDGELEKTDIALTASIEKIQSAYEKGIKEIKALSNTNKIADINQ